MTNDVEFLVNVDYCGNNHGGTNFHKIDAIAKKFDSTFLEDLAIRSTVPLNVPYRAQYQSQNPFEFAKEVSELEFVGSIDIMKMDYTPPK